VSTAACALLWVGAYLLGSVSWSTVIVRAVQGLDIRTVGSGNAGASNVLRAAGRKPAAFVLLLDVAKGAAAVLASRALAAAPPVVAGTAVAVVLGHVYPVFFGFRGGKGVATAAGSLGALAPIAMLLGLAVFVLVVAWKRYISLGSMVTVALFPFLVGLGEWAGWGTAGRPWPMVAAAAIAVLVIVKHRANLRRLARGTEPHLGERAVPRRLSGEAASPDPAGRPARRER
jgi:glycerol-3-phosphate acyltransferase PlsY